MATVNERLRHVALKLKRAQKHVADLDTELGAFLNSNPYRVGMKRDPQTRRPVYHVSSVESVPEDVGLILEDAIHNLVSTLDHLAYQLVCSEIGDNPPNRAGIYFPIGDSHREYESDKRRQMKGARQETFDALDALKPYQGGNDLLWMLKSLNNIEKHRLLLTVGSQAVGIDLGQILARQWLEGFADPEMAAAFRSMKLLLVPSDRGFPLKAGFELYIGAPDETLDANQQFRFTVALNEPGVCEGKPAVETIHQVATLVESIVTSMTPLLR